MWSPRGTVQKLKVCIEMMRKMMVGRQSIAVFSMLNPRFRWRSHGEFVDCSLIAAFLSNGNGLFLDVGVR